MIPETLDLFGSPAIVGKRGGHNAVSVVPHGVPKSRSSRRQLPRDAGGPLMTTPDLFSALAVPAGHFAAVGEKIPSDEHEINREVPGTEVEPKDYANLDLDVLPSFGPAPSTTNRPQNDTDVIDGATDGTTSLAISAPRTKTKRILAPVAGEIFICASRPATFAEAIEIIVASGKVDSDKINTFRREVNWVQTRLPRNKDGSPSAPLPGDPVLLRPLLQTISPGRHNITSKRWYNIRSVLAAVQRMTGWLPPRREKMPLTSKAWAQGLALFSDDRQIAMFRSFALFCEAHDLEPSQIEARHLELYRQCLELDSLKADPARTVEDIRYAWNRLHREHPNWGGVQLPAKRSRLWIRSEDPGLPAEYYTDLDAYCTKLRNPGLFPKGFPARTAEATINNRRSIFMLSPSVLVKCGWDPKTIRSLRDLVTLPAVEAILTAHHERNSTDGEWTRGAETTASALKAMAKQWAKLPPDELAAVEETCDSVRPLKHTFPKKAGERLAQFDDKAIERRFWNLPKKLWEQALLHQRKGRLKHAAEVAKYALALAIAFDKPLRVSNLAHLDLTLDFERDQHGDIVGIRIQGNRTTKRAAIIEGALSPPTRKMLKAFIEKFRPALLKCESSALFPGRSKKNVQPAAFGRHLKNTIQRWLGIIVNAHLIRALVATVILDEDPRAVVLAQRMLDHRTHHTILKSYGQQRGRAIQGEYAGVMHRRIKKLEKK